LGRISNALRTLQSSADGRKALAEAGFGPLFLARSGRLPTNGRAEGLAVLESVVTGGAVSALLSHPQLVRWLSRNRPEQLAALNVSSE